MAKIPLYAADGKTAGEIEASEDVFGAPLCGHLIHSVVVAYLANQRTGQARAKTRSEVRGGGRKPWRQKGTGRARAGTINSPLWRHGGVAHGPKQRDYTVNMPRKMLRKALRGALTSMARGGRILILEEIGFDKPETRKASGILKNFKLEGRVLFVIEKPEENFIKSFRNLGCVRFQDPMALNVYDVASSEHLITFRESLKVLEKRLGMPGESTEQNEKRS